MKLALGTAQFGLNYGVSNVVGQTAEDEARAIWSAAQREGVEVVDTAPAYGTSEQVLGRIIAPNQTRIVTKTPHFKSGTIGDAEVQLLRQSFAESQRALGRSQVYALMIHGAKDLLKPGGARLFDAMRALRDEGLIEKVGVSVYSGEEIDALLQQYPVEVVQLPLNVLDQSLLQGGQIQRLKERGIEVHARSAFLQGLLLMEEGKWPTIFERHFLILQRYVSRVQELGLSRLEAALGFVINQKEVDAVVCGVNSLSQWSELAAAAKIQIDPQELADLACDQLDLVDPTRWHSLA